MISKALWNKAQNLEMVLIDETDNSIEMIVGYSMTFLKKKDRFICGCIGNVLYANPICAHMVCAVMKCKKIPQKYKDALDAEIDDLIR